MIKKILIVLFILTISLNNFVYAETTMLVNQNNRLSEEYTPNDLILLEKVPTTKNIKISEKMYSNLEKMYNDILETNINNFYITSGFRDFSTQKVLYQEKVQDFLNKGYTVENARIEASKIVAIPGTSEHQTGLALDFTSDGSLEENFEDTEIGKWLKNNSYKYGFILRYPKNKTEITNIIYEPWHFRYVGEELALTLYENDWCLEEYYAPTNNIQEKLTNILDLINRGE